MNKYQKSLDFIVEKQLSTKNCIVEYYNLQNGEGTGDGGYYEFVDKDLLG